METEEYGSYVEREEERERKRLKKKKKRRVKIPSKGFVLDDYEDFFIDDVLEKVKIHMKESKKD